MLTRRLPALMLALASLLGAGLGTPAARAEVLHLPGGRFAGVTPARGVAPSSLPGAVARAASASAATTTATGQLAYNGGPVVHASAPYLILWLPSGQSLPNGTQSLLTRYFTDVAAASGTSANVYGVNRQYYDSTGFADYRQTFSSSQVIVDTTAYPARDPTNCPDVAPTYPTCVTDTQLTAEIQHEVSANHLPTDGPAGSETLPASAPVYFIVLPSDVDTCATWGSTPSCADSSANGFCAYHSSFSDTLSHTSVLYATIPTVILGAGQNPKTCQWDGNTAVQEPNGSAADVALKYLSHEHSEILTDPFGDAWWNPTSGFEDGDNCNAYGSANPAGGTSPNAFAPTLGGVATGSPLGSLYNQLISGDHYYLQSEWSNGDAACQLRPATGSPTASFSIPATITPPHASVRLDPSASATSAGWSSATWSYGDGSATTFNTAGQTLSAVSHVYAADGTYTATLTLVDSRGNIATTSRAIRVDEPPTASFGVTTSAPGAGRPTQFDATNSSDSDGTITTYAWDFGDGHTGTGATPTNTYQTAGTYTVTLTVTDSDGDTATTTHTVAIQGPTPTFSSTAALENAPVQFDGRASGDTSGAAIGSETWNFGDGTTVSGSLQQSHTYAHYGSYYVTLTLTDANGFTSSVSRLITVADEPPVASFTVTTAAPGSGQPTGFDATASSDGDGTITGYAWVFGDGGTGTGAAPSHVYAGPGTYTVALTVTDSDGDTATTTSSVTVAGPMAQFVAPGAQLEGSTLSFVAGSTGSAAAAPVRYDWQFGDGHTATGASATNVYATAGSYQATLTVTDANGDAMSVTHTVTVLDEPPTAVFSITTSTPSTQGAVGFDARRSSDSDGSITGYVWNFGDGTYGSGATPGHQYTAPGRYTVSLTVTDSDGQTSPAVSHVVTVYAPPQALFTIAGNGSVETTPLGFDATGSNDPGSTIVGYAWSSNDGWRASGVSVSHGFAHPGSYSVTLTVTDAVGLSTAITQWVTIGDEVPVAAAQLVTHTPLVGTATAFASAGSQDSDGHIVSYSWDFNDGTYGSGAHPTHTYKAAGHYTVVLTVVGSGGEHGSAHLSISVLVPGRITRVQARAGNAGPTVIVSVNRPGRLRVGRHTVNVHTAGPTSVQLRLSSSQQRALAASKTVRIQTPIAFAPDAGPPSRRTYTLSLHRPSKSHRYRVQLRP